MGSTCVKHATLPGQEVIYLEIGGVKFPAIKMGATYNFVQPDFSGYKTPRTAFSGFDIRRESYHNQNLPYYNKDMKLLIPDTTQHNIPQNRLPEAASASPYDPAAVKVFNNEHGGTEVYSELIRRIFKKFWQNLLKFVTLPIKTVMTEQRFQKTDMATRNW